MTEFQVTLGAMMDSVRSPSGQTRRKTGIAPQVLPSFGSVAYTGSGMICVVSPGRQSAAAGAAQKSAKAAPAAAAALDRARRLTSFAIAASPLEGRLEADELSVRRGGSRRGGAAWAAPLP